MGAKTKAIITPILILVVLIRMYIFAAIFPLMVLPKHKDENGKFINEYSKLQGRFFEHMTAAGFPNLELRVRRNKKRT